MAVLRVGGRDRITLPSGIREALGIAEGRRMVCHANAAGDIVLHPVPAPQVGRRGGGARPGCGAAARRRGAGPGGGPLRGGVGDRLLRARCGRPARDRGGRREVAAARDAS